MHISYNFQKNSKIITSLTNINSFGLFSDMWKY